MKRVLLLLLILLYIPNVYAESTGPEWELNIEGNNGEVIEEILKLKNEDIILIGNTDSTNIDGIENRGNQDSLIIKIDNKGNIIWKKSWGGNGADNLTYATPTKDGGFIAVGDSRSNNIDGITNNKGLNGSVTTDAVIVKFDSDGNVIWSRNLEGGGTDGFHSVTETKDGNYVAVGFSHTTNIHGVQNQSRPGARRADAIIAKFDTNGDLIWIKGWGGDETDSFNSVVQTDDGGCVVVGLTNSANIPNLTNKGSNDAVIVKYNQEGTVEWEKLWGGNKYDAFNTLIIDSDKNIVAAGRSMSEDIENLPNNYKNISILVKYDLEGNEIYHKDLSKDYITEYSKIINDNDSLILAGIGDEKENSDKTIKGIISKYNEEIEWENAIIKKDDLYLNSIIKINDDKYIVAGALYILDNEDMDIYGSSNGYVALISKYNNVIIENKEDCSIEVIEGTYTNNDNNYTILQNKMVKIKPIEKKGYNLIVTVKDKDGNIIPLKDMTFVLSKDVTITVEYKKIEIINPETITGIKKTIIIALIGIVLIIIQRKFIKKANEN